MSLIVNVPIADLRKEPQHLLPLDFSHNKLRETQLLFGEKVNLLHQKEDWLFVEALEQMRFTPFKGWHPYPGWVHQKEITLQKTSEITFSSTSFSKSKLIEDAEKDFLGTPYLWGGKAPYSKSPIGGVDCSGLIYMLYKKQGKIIPRDAHDQFLKSQMISKAELEPGDLLFWAPKDCHRRMTHVAIYKDKTHFIEAPCTGESVRICNLPEDFWEDKPYFKFNGRDNSYLVIPARYCE